MMHSNSRRAGFTLLETMVTVTLLGLVLGATAIVMDGMRRANVTGVTQVDLQREGERALARITEDLRSSGVLTADGLDYPYLFDDGEPDEAFEVHAHATPTKSARPRESDFGLDREIVFRLPADVTGPDGAPDGIPDVDANGALVWSDNETSFVLTTRADGLNYLERRTNGVAAERVAKYVERVVFDDTVSSGFEVPLGAIRVRVFLRKRDQDGVMHRHASEITVRLRNS